MSGAVCQGWAVVGQGLWSEPGSRIGEVLATRCTGLAALDAHYEVLLWQQKVLVCTDQVSSLSLNHDCLATL